MEIIQSSIRCFHCKSTLKSPVLLPCGESICEAHVQQEQKSSEFLCTSCGATHRIPAEGFYHIRALESIINTQIERLDLGAHHNEALKSCKRLDEILNEIGTLRADPNYFINERVNEIRNDVEIRREELKLKIDQEANRIVHELDEYEETCKSNWSSANFVDKLRGLEENIRETRVKLTDWMEEFKTIEFNDEKWRNIKQSSDKLIADLEAQVNCIKQDLLLNKFNEYRIKPIEFNEIDINSKKLRSKILNVTLKVDLLNICQFSLNQEWRLLYRASEDGFGASKFHAKCDNKPSTLTIVKSTSGYIFGGYTDSPWDQSNTYRTDTNAFLYSLVNKENKPTRMSLIAGKESMAIYGTSVSGPRFGGGSDLLIADHANANTNSFTNLGHTFRHPVYAHGSNESKCFIAGTYNYQVIEIEVFQKL